MAVYLNGCVAKFAKNIGYRTAYQLGQNTELPYFNTFEQPLLTLSELYQQIDQQISAILAKTGWQRDELSSIPILLGSTGYVIADCEARLARQQPLPTEYSIAIIGRYLQTRYQTEVYSFATSCTSSAQGIHYAYKMLQTEQCSKVLVIGFESFNRLTFEHFHSMGLLAPQTTAQGMILGEGLGCVALSRQASNCRLLGVANLTDSESFTNNNESKFVQLIDEILQQSGCSANDIAMIKPHCVGGEFDQYEQAFLQKNFRNRPLLFPKRQLGHTLGASGVLETAWLMRYLQKNAANVPLKLLSYFLGFGGSNVGWAMQWGDDH
ncbi:beta-ketoacyl synthase N-terminal-like domain-containing protein [Ursidibacter sp. B-7004-1]